MQIDRVGLEMHDSAAAAWMQPSGGLGGFFSGRVPSPSELNAVLYGRFIEHLAVTPLEGSAPVAFVGVFNANLRSQTAELAIVTNDQAVGQRRAAILGMWFAIGLAFEQWPLRKLYGRTIDGAFDRLRSAEGDVFTTALVIPDQVLVRGRYESERIVVCERSSWVETSQAERRYRRHGPLERI